jgi:quercetin dioxygenase-like cupin family protein
MPKFKNQRGLLRLTAAAIFVATTGFAFSAQAGECPSDLRKPNARQAVDFKPVGVTDTTLGAIDLGKEMAKIKGRELRFRKMVIQPGGIVPWHSHDDRPALIYVAEGEIIEYASNCAGPIHHKAGEIRPETQGTSHWWKNLSDAPVVLFIGDVRHDPNDHHM